MPLDPELVDFAGRFQAEVLERCQGPGDTGQGLPGGAFKENVFTALVVEDLLEVGVLEDAEVCYHEGRIGQGNVKVNAYGASEDGEALDLIVADYRHCVPPESVSPKDVRDATERALRFYREMVAGRFELLERSSDAFAMGSRLHEISAATKHIRVFVITDGLTSLKTLESRTEGGRKVSFQIWDMERLFRNLAAGRPHEAIEIDIEEVGGRSIPCLAVPAGEADYKAYLCVLPGDLLAGLYEEHGARLLELNVRSFLQARGKVNKGIRGTILAEPGHFFPYNNGLSLTAAEVRLKRGPDGRPYISFIRGLQIVNGGQTTASIHRAKYTDKIDLSRVFVQAKITEVGGERLEEMVPKISKYANSQNAVNEADFSANHPYHIELERLSLTTWVPGEQSRWFYERARGQYQVAKAREASTPAQKRRFEDRTPATQRFTKTDLAKFINSWDRLPHIVSRGGQKNFVAFMDRLRRRGSEWLPDVDYFKDLVAKAILFKQVQRLANEAGFPAYRANIVTYTVALLAHATGGLLDLRAIWENQAVDESLQHILRTWVQRVREAIVESAGTRNVTEWCKKEECWQAVGDLELSLPAAARTKLLKARDAGEDGSESSDPSMTDHDLENVAACRRLSSEDWLRVHGWGASSGTLTYWEKGVALTLSSYASTGWKRSPSAKQARLGVKAIAKARASGAL